MDVNFNNKVIRFWEWFKSIADDLLLDPTNSSLISQIDYRVSQLGHFDWEIGPFYEGIFYFAISPNLNIDRLAITRQIVDLSPKCRGWDFLSSKPPKKNWRGIWMMNNDFGKEISINSNNWEYILYQFEDKDFDMDIMIDDIDENLETCYLAIDIALTGYLGEEEYLRLIKNVKIVPEFGHEYKATKLKYIKNHIENIIN
jgi:hypothetical protein